MSIRPTTLTTIALTSIAAADSVVTFDDGAQGWNGPQGFGGMTVIEETGGNPGAHFHTTFTDFGITYDNGTNPEFVQDLTGFDTVTYSVDIKVETMNFLGNPTPRPWVLELRNYDLAQNGYPWVSVYLSVGVLFEGTDWTTYSVTFDPNATELPAGWGGTGDENEFFEPVLP